LKIKGKEAVDISQTQSIKVGGNKAEEVGGNYAQAVTGNVYVKGNMVVIESSSGLTLKCGGNFITLLPAGVFIQGTMVMINSGGAALPGVPGMLVPPTAPTEAEIADNADPGSKEPTYKQQRERQSAAEQAASNAPSHDPSAEENKDKTHWVEIQVVGEDGKPVPGVRYRVTLPDGQTLAEGSTDDKGAARVEAIDAGNCKVTFPDLDKEAWTKS
jgi:type VI secretion system secreted protein VgrG